MKSKIYFGISLTTTVAGFLMMAALLQSEGKLDNPETLPELWGGGSVFGFMGVIMGAVAAKAYARWGSDMGSAYENRISFGVMALPVFGVLIATFIGFLYVSTESGLLTRDQAPPVALLLALSVGWLLVQREPEVFVARVPEPEQSPEAIREEIFQRMIREGNWSEEEKQELRRSLNMSKSEKA